MPLKTVVQLRAPELLAHGPAIRRIEEQLRRNPALRLISPMLLEIGVKLHGQVLRPRNPAVQGIAMLFPDRMAQDNRMRKRTAAKLRVPVRLRTILETLPGRRTTTTCHVRRLRIHQINRSSLVSTPARGQRTTVPRNRHKRSPRDLRRLRRPSPNSLRVHLKLVRSHPHLANPKCASRRRLGNQRPGLNLPHANRKPGRSRRHGSQKAVHSHRLRSAIPNVTTLARKRVQRNLLVRAVLQPLETTIPRKTRNLRKIGTSTEIFFAQRPAQKADRPFLLWNVAG
jgi:hypothetical protein